MEARGEISDSTMFNIVNYHYLVRAKAIDEARRAAERKRPSSLPEWVRKKMGLSG
jgi:hypothetical protein